MMNNGDVENNQEAKARSCSNFSGGYKSNSTSSSTSETQRTSWLVPMIVVVNVIVFIMIMFRNNCPENNQHHCVAKFLGRFAFQPLRENPLFGPSSLTLKNMGALTWDKGVQGWRIFTCMWLHAGVIHLLVNMLSLLFIGIRLEKQFGFVPVGVIYLTAGVCESIFMGLFSGPLIVPHNISFGASGPLFGLLGAMISEMLTNWTSYTNKADALLTIIIIIMINLARCYSPCR